MKFGAGLLSALIAAALFSSAAPSAAGVVFSQPGDGTACDPYCSISSGFGDAGDAVGPTTLASFSVAADAAIQTIQLQGFFYDTIASNNPIQPVPNSWSFAFFSDSGGRPGTLITVYGLTASSVSLTYLDESSFNGSPVYVYDVTANLPSAFDASAGTTYWLLPYSFQPGSVAFYWSSPVAPGAPTWGTPGGPGSVIQLPGSRAFILSVPEPSTWAMGLLGFAALGVIGRQRARRAAAVRPPASL